MKWCTICIVFGLLLAVAPQIKADTLNVGPGEPYSTIQAAIDDADDGDIINVAPGTYAGAIVDKAMTILGASDPCGGASVITSGVPYKAGGGLTTAFRLDDTADGAEIKNFTIECNESGGFYFAVFARSADNVTVDSLIVNESVQGITNYGGSNWQITNNIISNSLPSSGGGISIWLGVIPSSYPVCSGNVVKGNRIITSYAGAVDFTCPAVGMGIDCRYGTYASLTFSEEMANNEISNNIMKDEGHSNQVGVEIGVLGLEGDPAKIAAVIGMVHDNIVKENTIQDTDAGVYFYNISTLTVQDNTIKNCADNGVYIDGDQSGCTINNNSIYGNINYGIDNNTPSIIDATGNWWGDAGGPSGGVADPCTGTLANGSGDVVSANVHFDPWLHTDPRINILKLDVQANPVHLSPDPAVHNNYVTIDMDALNLAQHVFGCQAILKFSSAYFLAGPCEVDVQPGGGVWDELIWSQWDTGGDLDVAVGVDLSTVVGTRADGTVAKFTLTVDSLAPDGTTQMVFRPYVDDIEATFFADYLAQAVYPGSNINSQMIVIDGTGPNVTNLTAGQDQGAGPVNVLDCANATLQGTVEITVDANDALSGMASVPAIGVNGPETLTAVLVDGEGPTFGWELQIDANTSAGTYTITITAADKAGNETTLTGKLCINKNEIDGTAAMDTWTVASYSFDRDVVFKATDSLGIVLEEWTVTVSFTNDDANAIASGSYNLKEVPRATANLSAKTDWTLRRKVAVSFDVNGQGIADFTGDDDLLGGDLNGSNTTNIPDFLVLRRNWFMHEAVADINGDGNVEASDFLVLRQNWFRTGDDE